MARRNEIHVVIVGAGAAGLMAAREFARAGRKVTVLEARERCGGRILPLPEAEFGYPAEGGAEFVHGEAPVTLAVLREAHLSLLPIRGTRWSMEDGKLSRRPTENPHDAKLQAALCQLKDDMTVAEFLRRFFAGPEYGQLRQSIERTVEGYDAADPERVSILALRDEWMSGGTGAQGRIAGGYGAVISFLAEECRARGGAIRLGSVVSAVALSDGRLAVRCADGTEERCDSVVLTVPQPLLQEIALPASEERQVAAAAQIGFGNVIKMLLRFKTRWWVGQRSDLADLSFLISQAQIPVWWTQHSDEHAVLTGWFGGPKTRAMADLTEQELIDVGVASLAGVFGLAPQRLAQQVVAARAIDWARDPFARGAYSYATPQTRPAQSLLASGGAIRFSGEAVYSGRDMGTVEAALASGLDVARKVLAES